MARNNPKKIRTKAAKTAKHASQAAAMKTGGAKKAKR